MSKNRPDIVRNGTATALLAPVGSPFAIGPGALLQIQADAWRVPRPLKLHRLHLFAADALGESLAVMSLTLTNKQLIYGPIPIAQFSGGLVLAGAVENPLSALDRWNPYLGNEVDENTQIVVEVQNFGLAAAGFSIWFSCGPYTGCPFPTHPNGV